MKATWKMMLALVLCTTTAMAEPDTFGLGTGRDGSLVVSEPRRIINHYAQVTGPLAPGDTVLFVESAEGFSAGDLVMVLQTTGIVPEPRRGAPGPIDLTHDSVGRWELARVESVRGGEVWLTAPLIHSYAASVTQLIRVPEYTNVEVRADASVAAKPWDGSTGGVLAFLARGTIRNDGELQANGAGFRGGLAGQQLFDVMGCSILPREVRSGARRGEGISSLSYGPLQIGLENASNGGGGGICPMSGGGGGGNGGAGGQGGDSLAPWDMTRDIGGRGGAALRYSMLDHLTLGGGGGKGHGATEDNPREGAGGGAIFIRGSRLTGTGSILAEGMPGGTAVAGGGSGGGAGGSIYMRVMESATCGRVSARGGVGGNATSSTVAYTGVGGGGGGGRVRHQLSSGTCPILVDAGPHGSESRIGAGDQSLGDTLLTSSERGAQLGVVEQVGSGSETSLLCTTAPSAVPTYVDFKSTTVVLEVVLSDNDVSSVRFYIDGSSSPNQMDYDVVSESWKPRQVPTLNVGRHSITVLTQCGSIGDTGVSNFDIYVDLTMPDTTIVSSPPNPSNDPNATFAFKALGETRDVKFKCSLDGAAEAICATGAAGNTHTRTYTNLIDGPHIFTVRAVDAAGNEDPSPATYSWTVALRPDTTITSKPGNPTNQTSASFSFTGTLNPTGFECKLEPSETAYSSCTSPKSYTGLSQGSYTFSVRAVSAAGVDPSPASHVWVIDTTAPETTLTSKPSDPSNSASASFDFIATETASFECKLDAGAYGGCTSPMPYSSLGQGSHTVCVRARDSAGNQEPEAACHTWRVDTMAPETALTSGPPDPSNTAAAEFSFSATEAASFECKLDAGAYANCTSPKTYSGLGEGNHTFCVKARDAAGNVEPAAACHTWKVDTVAPDTTLTSKPTDPDKNTTASFSFSATEMAVSFECSLDSGTYGGCISPKTYLGLADGSHTVCVRAQDAAGNLETVAACHIWTLDTVAPETVLTATPSDPSNSSSASFSFSTTDAAATFECKLDSGAYSGCTSPKVYQSLGEGSHTVCVRTRDVAGNVEPEAVCHTWKIDTRPPTTTIGRVPQNPTKERSAIFTFSASEDPATFECKLNTGNYAPCTSPQAYINLAEDSYIFYVRAWDSAGNVDPVGGTYEWQVDLTPPETALENKPPSRANTQSATFTFKSTGSGASFECKLDGGAFDNCGSGEAGSITYNNLAQGPHAFQVRALDAAGNMDSSPASYSWEVDLTAPFTRIRNKPNNPTNSTTASFTFDTDALDLSRFECRLGGGTFTDCNGQVQYPGLAPGQHVFEVRAFDTAGNVESPAKQYVWTIDTSSPHTDFRYTPPDPSNSPNAEFIFFATGAVAFSCSLDGSIFSLCSGTVAGGQGSQQYSNLVEGPHVFLVRATNEAGTEEATPARFEWNIDQTRPSTTIQSGPDRWTNVPKVDFVVISDEPRVTFECRLTGTLEFTAEFTDCPVPLSFELPDGRYTLEVRAKDQAGNFDLTPATYDWELDRKPPQTVILAPSFGQKVGTPSPEIKGKTEPNSTLQVSLDGASPMGLSADSAGDWVLQTSLALANGPHKVEAYAIDRAGNRGPTAFAIEFEVDTQSPETLIKSAPPDPDRSPIALFVFESSDPAAKFECSIDDAPFAKCPTTASFELPAGEHVLKVRAKDEANNVDEEPAFYKWTIILDPPPAPEVIEPVNDSEVDSLVPTISGKTVPTGQIDIFLEALEEGVEQSEVTPGCVPVSKAGLTDANEAGEWTFKPSTELTEGSYRLTARARNQAGLLSVCTPGIRFTVRAPKPIAHAGGGGLGCASSGTQPGLMLLAVVGMVLWTRRRHLC
jgi:MYXO-CTERM domain-containing protein